MFIFVFNKELFQEGISKSSQIVHDLFNGCQGMTTLNADWMKIIGDFTLFIVVIFVRKKSNRNNVLKILPVVRLKESYQNVGGCLSNWKLFNISFIRSKLPSWHTFWQCKSPKLASNFTGMKVLNTLTRFHVNKIVTILTSSNYSYIAHQGRFDGWGWLSGCWCGSS